MKTEEVNLLACDGKFVYVLARKLRSSDIISDSPEAVGKSDWGFVSVSPTLGNAEKCLERCVEAIRLIGKKETYGIVSVEDGKFVLLKEVRA